MKTSFLLFFLAFSVCSFSQDDSLRVIVTRNVLNSDLTHDNVRVENFFDVNDSLDFFIDQMQKKMGEVEEYEGVFIYKNVAIPGVGTGLKIIMYNGIWTNKGGKSTFKPLNSLACTDLKTNEKRGVRICVFDASGKDLMGIHENELKLTKFLEILLNKPKNADNE